MGLMGAFATRGTLGARAAFNRRKPKVGSQNCDQIPVGRSLVFALIVLAANGLAPGSSSLALADGAAMAAMTDPEVPSSMDDSTIEEVPLLPHRAVYELALAGTSDQSGIAGVRGLMVYDFSGNTCEGFSTSFRFVTEFQAQEGPSQMTDLRSSSHEAGDGSRLQFFSQAYVDQSLVEETKGVAEEKDGKQFVQLTKPKDLEFALPRQVLFPTMHLRQVIRAAQEGETLYLADVYDGAETGETIFATTTVIGPPQTEPVTLRKTDGKDAIAVPEGTAWPVTIAYFEPAVAGGGEQLPAYQMSFLLYDNGVSRSLKLDYGDFVLDGRMKQFELLDEVSADCAQPGE